MTSDDAHRQAEDALRHALLSMRGLHLAQSAVCTVTAWRAYRRPRLAAATLVASVCESLWLAGRYRRRQAIDDRTAACVDAAVGVGGLVALGAATSGTDGTTWMNWMCPVNLGTVAGGGVALGQREAGIVTAAIAGTYLATMKRAVAIDRGVLATVAVGTLGYAGYTYAGNRFSRYLRRAANEIEDARRDAVVRGERLAVERERVRQQELVSGSALEALDVVARGWDAANDGAVRALVSREASRLRSALSGRDDVGLQAALRDIAADAAAGGLKVELLVSELEIDVTAAQTAALTTAVREALENVARHAGVARVVLRAASTGDVVEVTVRDHGVGCDTEAIDGRGGIATRIVDPIRELGGTAELRSAPGRGMLVTLRIVTSIG